MAEQLQDLEDNWEPLDKDDRSSTVAWFKGGYEHPSGLEILVWQGVEDEEGNIHVETTRDEYDPDEHDYIVEVMYEHMLAAYEFATDIDDAWRAANEFLTDVDKQDLVTAAFQNQV